MIYQVKQATVGVGRWFIIERTAAEGYEGVVGSLHGYTTQAEAQTIADRMAAPSHLDRGPR